jgi:GH15 family glucan-1,4-alpha-glucosidase
VPEPYDRPVTAPDSRSESGAGYLPIRDHALIGNQYTAALCSLEGSIVWCCFPELKDGSVFASLLDHHKGGCFRVAPAGAGRSQTQHYLDLTAVLVTVFDAPRGRLSVTDFMPLRGSLVGCDGPEAEPEIHRIVACESGSVEVDVVWSPRFDYARARTEIEQRGDGFIARGAGGELTLAGVRGGHVGHGPYGPEVRERFRLSAGERTVLVTRYGVGLASADLDRSSARLDETIAAWRSWMHVGGTKEDFAWAGSHRDQLFRSAIVLKMLTHPRTGGIAAAPTTSLPEWIGGVRNWDYRYAWIRDASFTVQTLMALGHSREARDFVEFAERAAMDEERHEHDVKLMYDLHGGLAPDEEILEHLEGYQRSAPVRIGNAARLQSQHDVYGELIDCAFELVRRGERLPSDIYQFLARLADQACEAWRDPDHGIWELRAEPAHYTYSKLMIWVALDRAIRMAEGHGLTGNVERWRRNRDEVRQEILARGYDEDIGAFVMAYGSKDLDGANLRIPMLEFLPCSDPRVQGTIDRTLEQLTQNGLVYRYRVDDGLPGEEGAFGLCTFWMCEALVLSCRLDEARRMFDGMVARRNHVGLYSEEIDPATDAFLGNFPQAFTHIGFITTLLYFAAIEGHASALVPDPEGLPSRCEFPDPGVVSARGNDARKE